MLCPSVVSRFGTLADKQRFDAASAMGQSRSSGDVASMSELPSLALGVVASLLVLVVMVRRSHSKLLPSLAGAVV